MQLIDRIVDEDVPDLPLIYIVGVEARLRLLEMSAAERAVIIRHLDEREGSGILASCWRPLQVHGLPLDRRRAELPARDLSQKLADFGDVLLHRGLGGLERLDLLAQGLRIRGLGGWLGTGDDDEGREEENGSGHAMHIPAA